MTSPKATTRGRIERVEPCPKRLKRTTGIPSWSPEMPPALGCAALLREFRRVVRRQRRDRERKGATR